MKSKKGSKGIIPLLPLMYEILDAKALFETINTSAGIDHLLLAGIERMAFGADINTDILLYGASFKRFTAYAANGGRSVLGVDVLLHAFHLFCACNNWL